MAAYKWIVLSNTTIGSFMAALDISIVLIALPVIIKDLPGTGAAEGIWIVLGYSLVTSTLILNMGRLGDMFGRVKMYNLGFAIFTIGSFLCSVSLNGLELNLFRIVEGIGACFLWANSAAIITDAFPFHERGKALGINQVAIVVGSVFGLVLGGILTGSLGWRSIFWVNVPIGIFGTIWAYEGMKEIGNIEKGKKLDIWGNVIFILGLTLLLAGVTFGPIYGWSLDTVSSVASGVILLFAFVFIEKKVTDPMIDLKLFKIKVFAAGNLAILFFALSRGAFRFMMVFYFQALLGYGPLLAGILLIPVSASVALSGPLSGWLSDRYGPRWFAACGLALTGAAFLIMSQLGAFVSYYLLFIPFCLLGIGMGLFSSPNRSVVLSSVPSQRRGIAAGTNSTLANVGLLVALGIGIALMGATVPHNTLISIFDPTSGQSVQSAGIAVPDFMRGLHNVFLLSSALSFIGMIPVIVGYRHVDQQLGETEEQTV